MAVGWNMLQFQFTIAVCLCEALESEILGSIFSHMPLKLVCHFSFHIVSKH